MACNWVTIMFWVQPQQSTARGLSWDSTWSMHALEKCVAEVGKCKVDRRSKFKIAMFSKEKSSMNYGKSTRKKFD